MSVPSRPSCAHPRGVRPPVELADILRRHAGQYVDRYDPPRHVRKTLAALAACRTAQLGGHLERCPHCGFQRPAYNSCRNRHCPKCQGLDRLRWLEKREAELLSVPYFHLVFTLPHALNRLVLANQQALLGLLFRAVSATLEAFGRSRLGGRMGGIGVLHTWDQKLLDHFHLHCLVPAGALAEDGSAWRPTRPDFLFPVRALSRVFRAKFLAGLDRLWREGQLSWPQESTNLAEPPRFQAWRRALAGKDWVVFAKAPLASSRLTLEYLGRYTYRVAISNRRLTKLEARRVTFQYRDRASGSILPLELEAVEFIRRFALHILPARFVRVRGFGFLANRAKKSSLARCRQLLGSSPEPSRVPKDASWRDTIKRWFGYDPLLCPQCGQAALIRVEGGDDGLTGRFDPRRPEGRSPPHDAR